MTQRDTVIPELYVTDEAPRDQWMKRLCVCTALVVILSIVCVVVGGLAIAKSAPTYTFPYCLGGAMIAGIMSILSSCCVMCVYCEYPRMTEASAKDWERWMPIVISFVVISLILGAVFSGIWGISQTSDHISLTHRLIRSSYDLAYELTNQHYAIASFVLVFILSILHIVSWCLCCRVIYTYHLGSRPYQTRYTYSVGHQGLTPHSQYATYRSCGVDNVCPLSGIHYETAEQAPASSHLSENSDLNRVQHNSNHDISIEQSAVACVGSTDSSKSYIEKMEINTAEMDEPEAEIPPPSYEEIEEDRLPSYREVVTEGRYISTGFTEFVTKI